MTRVAVVLMNLGGPNSLGSVEPFLYNLFKDPAIIRLPTALRLPLARLIARARAKTAREIYARLGGASPLLANTEAQAQALEMDLGDQYRCFVAMRYWDPTSAAAARAVSKWDPDEIVCFRYIRNSRERRQLPPLPIGGAQRRARGSTARLGRSAAILPTSGLSKRLPGLSGRRLPRPAAPAGSRGCC